MPENKPPRTNPLTGTVVIEPPAAPVPERPRGANATVELPAPPRKTVELPAPQPTPRPAVVVAPPGRPAAHPLEGTVVLGDIASLVAGLPPLVPEEEVPPATQAIPLRLNGPAVPFAGASHPHAPSESERASQLPPRAPWSEVRDHVQPAGHALSGTLVAEPPASVPPATELAPRPLPRNEDPRYFHVAAPAPSERSAPAPASEPNKDPWGAQLRDVEQPVPQPAPEAPAAKLPERKEVRKGLYGKFFKTKT
ncbi:MAG: hypothetical protein HOW73_44650 [Polyangiaceae bacterium]|nr:hypothetical protein [Polyangiaceae bacterium]